MPFKPHLVRAEDLATPLASEQAGPRAASAAATEDLSAAVPSVSTGLSPAELAELPAELQLLAEQLMDDADHLASQYPPGAEQGVAASMSAKPRASQSQVPWGRIAAAIVVVVGSFWGSAKLARRVEQPSNAVPLAIVPADESFAAVAVAVGAVSPETVSPETVSAESVAVTNPVAAHMAREDRPGAIETQSTPTPFPAMFFQDLSAPEQEGLLDLLEDEVLAPTSVSI